MGIDLLDISYRVERQLGVFISADDWHDMVEDGDITVQTVYDCVLGGTQVKDQFRTNIGLNAKLWEQLQSAIAHVADVPVENVQLHSKIAHIFGSTQPSVAIKEIGEISDLHMPRQDLSLLSCFSLLASAACVLVAACHDTMVGLTGFILFGMIAILMKEFSENRLPSNTVTLKDFYRTVRDRNYLRLRYCAGELVDDETVFMRLREVLVDALGVDDDEVTLNARLAADLGCE